MKLADIIAKIQVIFREKLKDKTIVLTSSTTADDINGWDSLEHVRLIMAIEEEFQIKFTMSEIGSSRHPNENLGNFAQLIANKIN